MTRASDAVSHSESGIEAVILDYGEGLCHLPTAENIDFLSRTFQMNPQSFLPIYLKTRGAYDRGDVHPAEYWQNFAVQAGVAVDVPTIERLRQVDNEMWSRPNEPMVRWLDWLAHFDHHIFSAEVRSAKPEPAIYQHTIQALGVPPSAALFIDDREENLVQARAISIRTIRYHSVEQLRADLRALNFPILP